MKKIITLIMTIVLVITSAFAQVPDADESIIGKDQEDQAYNLVSNIQNIVDELRSGDIGKIADTCVSITTLLICIGAICSICTKTMSAVLKGDTIKLEVLLKPFIFAIILGSYQPIVKGIDYSVSAFDGLLVSVGNESLENINKSRKEKTALIEKISKKQEDEPWYNVDWTEMYDRAKSFLVFHTITLLVFCATFLTKLTGAVLSMIFYIIGPIAIALSAIPAFSDNWKNWLLKYIWVLLFTPICRIISWVLQEIELIILRDDISRLTYCYDNYEKTKGGITISGGSFMEGTAYIGFMIVGAMLFMAVPSIASWVVNTSGGGIMTAMNTIGADMMSKGSNMGKSAAIGSAKLGGKGAVAGGKAIGKGASKAFQAVKSLFK